MSSRAESQGPDGVARACLARLREGFAAGSAGHGRLDLSFERFTERVLAVVVPRTGCAAPDVARLRQELARTALEDLYLAVACDEHLPGAWEALDRGYVPRLVDLAQQHRAGRDADEIARTVLADLLLQAPRRGEVSRLATYDGSGSLFAWLAVMLLRALGQRYRARRHASLEEASGSATFALDDPADQAQAKEAEVRFQRVLAGAWEGLTDRERIALACKYRDQLPQTEIAVLLGVGTPRVSRIVSAAMDKVRHAVRTAMGRGSQSSREPGVSWRALVRATARHLAIPPPPRPLSAQVRSTHEAAP